MTVVDTSAILAVLLEEPGSDAIERELLQGPCIMSAASRVELGIVIEARTGAAGTQLLDELLARIDVRIAPVDEDQAREALACWRRFGKGGHEAALNFGDTFAYALAQQTGQPLLYADGVAQTDDEPGRLRRVVGAAKQAADATARAVGEGAKTAAAAGTSTARALGNRTAKAGIVAGQAVGAGGRWAFDSTIVRSASVFSAAQSLIASDLSAGINHVVAAVVKGPPTIYDKAMDAAFLETFLGGSYHRHFDGGHTILGAFRAAHNASPDDTLLQETLGTIQGLLRDVHTPRGLPLATWDKATFGAVADSLKSNFGIPKSWLYDLSSYDAADLLGGTVGAISVIFGWSRTDTETFAQLAASMSLSAALSTNPLLMPIAVVALGRSFHLGDR